MIRRQELLINLVLLAAIVGLAYTIYSKSTEVTVIRAPKPENAKPLSAETETAFDAQAAQAKYPKFGETKLFRALLTPTPTPPPVTPAPTPTPNIHNALAAWALAGVDEISGEVTIEDKSKPDTDENKYFNIKLNEARPVQADKEVKNATLIRLDPDLVNGNPSATFKLDGSGEEKTIKMMPDPEPEAAPGAPPAAGPQPRRQPR